MRDLQNYFRPKTVDEAVRIKRDYGPRAVYLAGGSDLLVHRPVGVEAAIDIRHADIGFVMQGDDAYVIGGAALLRDVESTLGAIAGGMLGTAVRETAPWLIRNAATLAGNVANNSPAADSVPALLVLDATLRLQGDVTEDVAVKEVLVAPHRTNLGNRLITEIRIPAEAAGRRGAFIKFSRSKSDIAQVNIAVAFRLDGDVMRDVRVALGAVAPTAVRACSAEAALEGQQVKNEVLDAAAASVKNDISPISDWRASAEYRTRLSGVLLRRAVRQAATLGEGVKT
jgi:carbon-monoxide dehydrogenase medium subunit